MGAADIDYGLIGKALALGLLAKGVKNYVGGQQTQHYADTLNQGLPSDYQINYHPSFMQKVLGGGNAAQQQATLKALYDQKLKQQMGDAYAQRMGMPKGTPQEFAKDVYNSEYAPVVTEGNKQQISRMMGGMDAQNLPALMQYFQQIRQGPQSYAPQQYQPMVAGPGPTAAPVAPAQVLPPMDDGQQQPLPAGAAYTQYPELPPGFSMSPETLRSMMSMFGTMEGHDVQREGQQIQRDRLGFDQKRYNETDKPYKEAQMTKLLEETKWIGPKARAYIRSTMQQTGRAPTKIEVLQEMRRTGEITNQQFRDSMLDASPGKGRGQEDMSPTERQKLVVMEKKARRDLNSSDPARRRQARADLDYISSRSGATMGQSSGVESGGGRQSVGQGKYGFRY
jgi:hypothetical protein